MSDYQLLPNHRMVVEVTEVTRHSSSWNQDYQASELHLVCECGAKIRLHDMGVDAEASLACIEHSIRVLGEVVFKRPPGPAESYGETPQDRYD